MNKTNVYHLKCRTLITFHTIRRVKFVFYRYLEFKRVGFFFNQISRLKVTFPKLQFTTISTFDNRQEGE